MLVRDAMSLDMMAVAPDDRASTAVELLIRRGISGLPVVDADRRALGMITELDLMRALRQGHNLREIAVSEVMHPRPVFVEPSTDLYTAAALMEDWQVRRLPVCEQGRLVGVISRSDVLRALVFVGTLA